MKMPNDGGGAQANVDIDSYGLKFDDLAKFSSLVNNLQALTPIKIVRLNVRYRERNIETDVAATMPWYPDITNYRLLAGVSSPKWMRIKTPRSA